ncbi:MAG: hypothetical protein RR573_07665, partial [Oscillospiraceae bacterium]
MWDKILLGCAIATTAGAVYGYVSGQSTEFTCLWLVATAVLLTITVIIRGVRLRAKKRYVQELEAQVQQQKEQIVAVQKAGKDELASFYSTLSHTLRMPLSIVRGYAELLEGGIVT